MPESVRKSSSRDPLNDCVLSQVTTDFTTIHDEWTVHEALQRIREHGVGERIVYFYVLDFQDRLVGVVPTRRLLTAPPDHPIRRIMIERVVAIPHTATLLEACEWFVLHKFLAFPVVDDQRHIVGVLEVSAFTDEVFDIAERRRTDDVFDAIGFRVAQVRDASPLRAFRYRFPWLLVTIAAGTVCALIASANEVTLSHALILAFFLMLVLGLGEGVSVQSMTVTVQALHTSKPTFRWYLRALRREVGTAFLLGLASAIVVGLIIWLWRDAPLPALAIATSILLILCIACFLGLSVPALLHTLKLDPMISAGPVTLALTDIVTLACYFGVAALVLR